MAILRDGEKQVDRIKDVEVEEENEEGEIQQFWQTDRLVN